RSRRLKMLQARKVKRKRGQHGNHSKDEKESPGHSGIVGGGHLPRWVHDEPKSPGTEGRVKQHSPAIVARENPVARYVVEGERNPRTSERGARAPRARLC